MDTGEESSDGAGPDGAVLADLPPDLWGPLLRAVRRAVDDLPRSRLPKELQPFAGWHPERLQVSRVRRAVASALVEDSVLRERVGARIEPPSAMATVTELDAGRMAERYGPAVAVATLAASGRWEDIPVVAARIAERGDTGSSVAAEAGQGPDLGRHDSDPAPDRGSRREARRLRDEREHQRRRAESAEERASRAERRVAALQSELAQAQETAARRHHELATQRRRDRSRIARLKEELKRAQERPVIAASEAADVADQLDRLAGTLRRGGTRPGETSGQRETAPPTVPREPAPAEAGRPCVLPSGLSADSDLGARSVLRAPGIRVFLDGYNISLDATGVPGHELEQQRRWLVGLAGAACARFGCRATVVFDGRGSDQPGGATARDVLVVFSANDETADDRIIGLVEDLSAATPALVVTSDRELAARARELKADVVASHVFVEAVSS